MKKEKKKKINMSLNDRIAKKVLEPYMTQVLKVCYDLRELSYAMTFEKWCEKVNEQLKINLEKRKESKKC